MSGRHRQIDRTGKPPLIFGGLQPEPENRTSPSIYLGVEEAGVGPTGIGCYFDDPVHAAFGIVSREWQHLYRFTVGGSVEDRRVSTLPAYNF